MTELGPAARGLIESVGDSDGPAPGTRERVRTALGATLGASAALGSSAALGAQATGAGAAAALAGKSSAAIALWFIAGGAAGIAVATPLAVMAERPTPALVAPAAAAQRDLAAPAREPVAVATAAPYVAPRARPTAESEPAKTARRPPIQAIETRAPALAPAPPAPAPAFDVATELALLKAAQRELNTANAGASLALLDDHARRYPDGALKAERLGARVFALCKLGRVEEARAAAREFLRVAADSPLVPRVLSSCGGTR
jgi:hypothetical protein